MENNSSSVLSGFIFIIFLNFKWEKYQKILKIFCCLREFLESKDKTDPVENDGLNNKKLCRNDSSTHYKTLFQMVISP